MEEHWPPFHSLKHLLIRTQTAMACVIHSTWRQSTPTTDPVHAGASYSDDGVQGVKVHAFPVENGGEGGRSGRSGQSR